RKELNRKPSMSTFTQIVYPLVFTREGVSAGLVVVGPLSTLEGSNLRVHICVRFDPSRVSTVCCALTPKFHPGLFKFVPSGHRTLTNHMSTFTQIYYHLVFS